jgi:hypothetical protein
MPQVFKKDTKISVIEYGDHVCSSHDLKCSFHAMVAFIKKLFA